MLNLYDDSTIKQTLPESIKNDKEVQSICDAIQPKFDTAYGDILNVLLLPRLDELSEALLDELAWQYHVDFYRDNYPLETKRTLIRSAIERHRIKGTPAIVQEVVKTCYQYAVIEEWFEYGGDPYYFRILLRAQDPAPPLSIGEVMQLIDAYKSYRSWLEGIYYHIPHDLVIGTHFGYEAYWGRVCGTYPYRRRYGSIEDHDLVVETHKGGILYRNPFTNELVAGTFPYRRTRGEIKDEALVVETEKGGLLYRNPFTDELVSGTFPEPRMEGSVSEGDIAVETAEGNMLYRNPHTNEIVSGTFPESSDGSGITANTAAGDISYSARFCGSTPGSLF